MRIRAIRQATLLSVLLVVDTVQADVVTLSTGGVVRGNVVPAPSGSGPKGVAVRTQTGGLVIVEQHAVRQVLHASVNASKKAAPKAHAGSKHLTPAQEAWFPKIRSLVAGLTSGDPNRSRRARADLLDIDSPDALPALRTYLGNHPSEDVRMLCVEILRRVSGPEPTYLLVAGSLFDRSPQVREKARKAISPERADAARALYIEALKARVPNLASLAARGISEIGDPNGEAVPYLIDSLDIQTSRVVAISPGVRNLGVEELAAIQLENQLNAQSQLAPSTPVARLPQSGTRVEMTPPMGGNALANSNISQFPLEGPMFPPVFGANNPPAARPVTASAPVTMRDIMNTPVQYTTGVIQETDVNLAVYDALVKVTGQQFGNNLTNWRRWWQNQQKNRESQAGRSPDKDASKTPNAREANDPLSAR
jgi:hypothetical protein